MKKLLLLFVVSLFASANILAKLPASAELDNLPAFLNDKKIKSQKGGKGGGESVAYCKTKDAPFIIDINNEDSVNELANGYFSSWKVFCQENNMSHIQWFLHRPDDDKYLFAKDTISHSAFTGHPYDRYNHFLAFRVMPGDWLIPSANDIEPEGGIEAAKDLYTFVPSQKHKDGFYVLNEGLYHLKYKVDDFTSPTVAYILIVHNNLAVPDIDSANENAKIYPNPVRDVFRIDPAPNNNEKVQVFDLNGKLVFESQVSSQGVNIGHLPSGNYIVKIGNLTQKIIKQ